MSSNILRRSVSRIGMAVALATGTAVVLTAAATPAYAKKDKEAKPDYSKPFVAAYQPFVKKLQGGADPAELKADLPAVVATASTDDDKLIAGQLTYNVGVKAQDQAMERQGLNMMLDSGKMPQDNIGNNYYVAAQLAYQAQDWADAIKRAKQADAAGFTKTNPNLLIAEAYFAQNQTQAGLDTMDTAIAKEQSEGQPVPEDWIKRALSIAYRANLKDPSLKYAALLASTYPSKDTWGDAISIERTFYDFDGAPLLDLMRLAGQTNSLRNKRDYLDYVFSGDARRVPAEILKVINEGVAAGQLSASDMSIQQTKAEAEKQAAADKTGLPELGSDADKPNANLATLVAAGDTFLSYDQPAKALGYYERAIALPGVDANQVLTRMGIAQVRTGKFTEAEASFAKVQGNRQPIAKLWAAYAKSQADSAAAAAQPAAAATPPATDGDASQ
ncbi:hypothetical protein [Tsuneonella mangrovi]|uniref:hypothetical protein n=1 Tax=Tsuneonella mangrovi TaxID=1982042 RepID=UPI000BA26C67|nr:hypothetical protein [Tsuneonella mangrovi]